MGNSLSDSVQLGSGVVQGSCIRFLLFLLYINDVTFVISHNCKCKLYGDDLKLYSEITVADDCRALQDVHRLTSGNQVCQLRNAPHGNCGNGLAGYKYAIVQEFTIIGLCC